MDVISFREATNNDIAFLSEMLVGAIAALGVDISVGHTSAHPDTYQYVVRFTTRTDVGIIAEKEEEYLLGAAWIRSRPTDLHTVNELLRELTMGVCNQNRGNCDNIRQNAVTYERLIPEKTNYKIVK